MQSETNWEQLSNSRVYRLAVFGSFLYLPLAGHLATWFGLAERLDRWAFFSLDVQLWIGMASGPFLILPALLAAGLINLLDWKLPSGCYLYASLLPICLLAVIGGGLFVGPLLDF